MAGEMSKRMKEVGSIILDTIKGNPVPAALSGVGIGWLVMEALTRNADEEKENGVDRSSEGRETGRQIGSFVPEKGEEVSPGAGEIVSEPGKIVQPKKEAWEERWRQMTENRTLTLGAAAFALGVILGFLVPKTRREDELMDKTGSALLNKIKETAKEFIAREEDIAV